MQYNKKVKQSWETGFSFGLTSGVITTLGLIVGLNAGTHSKLAVIGGILTIALADAFSDALGIHISQESQNHHSPREVWEATVATFISKLLFALSFVIPFLIVEFSRAIVVSIIWGFSLLAILSFFMAKGEKQKPWKVISEHLLIGLAVVVISQILGNFIAKVFS